MSERVESQDEKAQTKKKVENRKEREQEKENGCIRVGCGYMSVFPLGMARHGVIGQPGQQGSVSTTRALTRQ